MAIDLFTLIFEEFLKISPSLLNQYSLIQDQLLYLIFIPHVVLLLFLWTFGYWVVPNHKGFRFMFGVVGYIYFVWAGWYGSFIIPIITAWLPLVLLSYFGFFIMTKIFHPLNIGGAQGVTKAVFDKAKGSIDDQKNKEIIAKEIQLIDKKLRELQHELAQAAGDRRLENIIKIEISNLKQLKIEKEHELNN